MEAKQRIGQSTFRVIITDAYERRCAVTGERVLPVLEAAHIRPVSEGGVHRVGNSILLRSDIHTLLDRGYIAVAPSFEIRVSNAIKDTFDNGEHYYQLKGSQLSLPKEKTHHLDKTLLEWHSAVMASQRVEAAAEEDAAFVTMMAILEADSQGREHENVRRELAVMAGEESGGELLGLGGAAVGAACGPWCVVGGGFVGGYGGSYLGGYLAGREFDKQNGLTDEKLDEFKRKLER